MKNLKEVSQNRRITMQVVNAIAPGEIIWDTDVRGFGIRCQRNKKVYLLKARINGRARWFSIGEHGAPWTPDSARKEAQRLWGQIRSGEDLAAVREARRKRPSMAELCTRYLDEHAHEHKKASSAHLDERNIENHVRPFLGEMFVEEVSRADIDRFKRAVKDGKTRNPSDTRKSGYRGGKLVTGGSGVANRCLALLSKMFNLAERWGWRVEHTNPVRHVEKYKEQKRERYLSVDELARLSDALAKALIDKTETPYVVAVFRLLVLTGARLSEILTLRWQDVDLQHGVLRLPDSKTGRKTVWLNTPALSVLEDLPRVAKNPFVIVGDREGAHLVNTKKPWRRICKAAGITSLRIHDLRHSFASVAVGSGLGLHITGKMMGHLRASTTERYAHLADGAIREANELVGQKLIQSLDINARRPEQQLLPKRVA
jgi:integrase